jgi:glycosyltransferase involved in cell wall biosynthesis
MSTDPRASAPLVAIVTPVYNGGKYLRQTMECVQAQTYPNIVHVLLNNCSSDDSAAIIADFAGQRVPVLAFANDEVLPLAANWNRAFSLVPDEAVYAKLLCADDLIRSDAISRFVDVAEANPTVEVVLSRDVFDDRVHRSRLSQTREIFNGTKFVQDLLMGKVGWLAFHHFFVRIQPEYRNGRFIDDYWSPDPHVVLRSALRGDVAYLHEPLVYYRYHMNSVTGKELSTKGVQFDLVHMHLLRHFGEEAFATAPNGRAKLRGAYDDFFGRSCRRIMRCWVSGERPRARALLQELAKHGYRLGPADYLRHLIGWPLSSIKWRLNEIAPGNRVDERSFTAFRPGMSNAAG